MKNKQAKRVDIVSIRMVKEKSVLYSDRKVGCPKDGYLLVREFLEDLDREALVVVCLNSQNEPTNISVASLSTLDSSPVHPREVMKTAVLSNASSIFLAHKTLLIRMRPTVLNPVNNTVVMLLILPKM